MQEQKAEKSNVVFAFAITTLVMLCIQFIVGIVVAAASATSGLGGWWIIFSIAGIITDSIFIHKYNKYGYDLKDLTSYGIVFIVFGVLSWGWWAFGLVTGILILCLRGNKNK